MTAELFFENRPYIDDEKAMLEKHNITKLVEYDRYCRDNLLFDKQEECYSDQSRVRITWYDGDGKAFVKRSAEMTKKSPTGTYSTPHHKMYNTFVWLNGDKAVAESQCMMGAYHKINGVEYHRLGWARLLYRTAKENGVWKIKGLDCIYERDMLLPVIPRPGAEIDPAEFEKYRLSYKCVSWLFEKQGLPCDNELPGDDRPEMVLALYKEASQWLYDEKQ